MQCDDLSITEAQVAAARDGDEEALDKLLGRYLPRVRRIVASRTGHTVRALAELEDIVQETFADAVAGIHRFEHQSDGAFCHWIATCVENNVRDLLRRGAAQKRGQGRVRNFADLSESTLHESIFAGVGPTPSQQAGGHEAEERLERALQKLSPRHREVIELRAHCRMSFREIAARLALRSENTANALFLRARDRLCKLVGV